MLHIFTGHDERAAVGTHVFTQSVLEHAKETVLIAPITRLASPGVREGTNAFTFRRFLVPYLMDFRGWAVFCDGSDMLCRADINDIAGHCLYNKAVCVVKHDYKTRHPRKYVGTAMESDNADYDRKNWASVFVLNCAHQAWRHVTPEFVEKAKPLDLLQFRFIDDAYIGSLPLVWNWLPDEMGENLDAKLIHFTAGSPAFDNYRNSPMANEWHTARGRAMGATG